MAIPCSTLELENKKFVESPDGSGEVAIRTAPSVELNPFGPPLDADAITVGYPNATTEVYEYRTGGTGGSILKTVTVTYTSGAKNEINTVVIT
jgi:hypothetical protein